MDPVLLWFLGIMIAALFGFLWYTLNNIGGRIDKVDTKLTGVDDRLREVEERLAALEAIGQTFQTVEERVRSVEDRMIRWEERFSHAEDQLRQIRDYAENIDKRTPEGVVPRCRRRARPARRGPRLQWPVAVAGDRHPAAQPGPEAGR